MTEDNAPYFSFPEEKPETKAKDRFKRLFEAAECHTQSQLAAFLDVGQSAISDAKKRGSIPSEWLLTLLQKKINPNWVLTGVGARLLRPAREESLAAKRLCETCSTDFLLTELASRILKGCAGMTDGLRRMLRDSEKIKKAVQDLM